MRTYTRARAHACTHTHTHCHQCRITRGRDFFITVRADCIFLRLPTTRVSNLENRVEGGPSNHVSWQSCPASILATPAPPRAATLSSPCQRVLILGHNPLLERTKSLLFDGCRGDWDAVPLSLSFSLFSSPLSPSPSHLHVISFFPFFSLFFLHHTDRPFTIRGRLFNRA